MGIIFDLDYTIIDSSIAKDERRARNWKNVYELIPKMQPFKKVVDFINLAVQSGIEVAIVTSSPRPYCEKVLNFLGIDNVITVCYHDTQNHKPDSEPLLLAIKKMKNQEGKMIVAIGDQEKDIVAANNIHNVVSILGYWGNRASFINSDVRPDIYCRDEEALLRYFLSLGCNIPLSGLRYRSKGIFYMYDYYPISRKHDNLSQQLFNEVKGYSKEQIILTSFCRCFLKRKKPKGICGIFVVPSSRVGMWNEQLMRYVVPALTTKMGLIDCSQYLYRYKEHEKQAFGGNRSVHSHIETIKVQYELPRGMSSAFIIDDITTTGNIFDACRMLLVEKGILHENIYCAAVGGTVFEN